MPQANKPRTKPDKGPHPGVMSLKGVLASDKGRGMTFSQIRAAAAVERFRQHAK